MIQSRRRKCIDFANPSEDGVELGQVHPVPRRLLKLLHQHSIRQQVYDPTAAIIQTLNTAMIQEYLAKCIARESPFPMWTLRMLC